MKLLTKRISLLAAFICCCSIMVQAQSFSPETYYAQADGKKKVELKTAMKDIIANHTKLSYGSLWTYYEQVDYIESGDKLQVFDYYSDYVAYFPEPSTMNKEHTVPQSWWGGGTGVAQGSDIFHVLPSEKNANGAKGSYPLGIVTGTISYPKAGVSNTRMKTGKDKNGKMVFEPCDEYKGDFARIYMYVATCYSDVNWQRQNDLGCVLKKEEYPTFTSQEFINMLLQWSRQDPVSEWERTRNERVYAVQNNRNPYVDYPSLCEFVWGDSIDYAFDVSKGHSTGGEIPVDTTHVTPPEPDPDTISVKPVDSGLIELASLNWRGAYHSVYGDGFEAVDDSTGLTIGYYKYNSNINPIAVGSELRLYMNAALVISGAEITGITFYGDRSKLNDMTIDGQTLSWANEELTWTGHMEPFVALASGGQSRIKSIGVSVVQEIVDGLDGNYMSPVDAEVAVFDMHGRYVGSSLPHKRGTYIRRMNGEVRKIVVK